MEIRQLVYLQSLIENGSFSLAAERCGVAQPSLSQQIKKLEDELGCQLVSRARSGVKLTQSGHDFWRSASSILQQTRQLEDEFLARKGRFHGRLKLGVIPTIAPYWLPGKIEKLRSSLPDVGIDLVEEKTDVLRSHLMNDEIPFAVYSDSDATAKAPSGLEERMIGSEKLWLAVSKKSSLAGQRSTLLAKLSGMDLLVLQDGHCLKDHTVKLCKAHDFKPNNGLRCASLETLIGLVEADLGISFIPDMAKQYYRHRDIDFLTLRDADFRRSLYLVSKAGRKFAGHEQKFIKQLLEPLRG
ncbi:LysR family transcriptional regulator [Persicirhabdus sediminis]|uniref:LysR family transcriptional regulator n=1 Tax=Persicirhabdus sediminis TaxID=454144 RepID=A0A8J7MGC1_9BACT|nr:LysR substrate-binding domain-containing protein [Persicirhabdus sediminis]MBK1792467.1 LysR family transcriptional regulator [Persicirhabdus sediminis]